MFGSGLIEFRFGQCLHQAFRRTHDLFSFAHIGAEVGVCPWKTEHFPAPHVLIAVVDGVGKIPFHSILKQQSEKQLGKQTGKGDSLRNPTSDPRRLS